MSDCVYCGKTLGDRELVPGFAAGKRIAFDAATARVWAVCARCNQWNLAPLDVEERHRAVERLEQAYASAASRTASDAIGVAELGDGVSLVRVGSASWGQLAAWRYGQKFPRRRTWAILTFFAVVATSQIPYEKWLLLNVWTTAATVIGVVGIFYWALRRRVWSSVRTNDGSIAAVRTHHADQARLVATPDGWALVTRHDGGEITLTGKEALRVLRDLLPRRNQNGGTKADVREAVEVIERAGGTEALLRYWLPSRIPRLRNARVLRLPLLDRLILEIAAQEEAEKRVLAGELASLRLDARNAEAHAHIVEELA